VRLTLVIPCFDEAEVLPGLYAAVSREVTATGHDYELLFVDDGSGDGTLDLLRRLGWSDPHVRYLSFSRNFGKEAAMLAGLRHATGDAVLLLDADLQHPPELIPRLLDLHAQGFDQVVARRTRAGDPAVRTLLSRAYYWLVNRWVDVELVDGVGDYRLLSRRAVDAVLALGEYNRFSKGLFSWIGFEVAVVEYDNVGRDGGGSRWTVRRLVEYGIDGMLSFNNRPLRLAIYLGLLLSAVASGYALWVVGAAVAYGVDVPGYVTLLVAVVGLGGLHLVMLGIIGEYIGRIYYETKKRPHYLIRDTSFCRPGDGKRIPLSAPAAREAMMTTRD
jgi:polyisoprenyl-phosphate glycosyltransferase